MPGVHFGLSEDRPARLRHADHPLRAGAKCVELKSLKLYLQQYRNEGIFYEDLTNRILDDLVAVLAPRQMTLVGRLYRPRRHYDDRDGQCSERGLRSSSTVSTGRLATR